MFIKIGRLVWKEYKWQALSATLLLFIAGLMNGLGIAAILPLLNSTSTDKGTENVFFQKIFDYIFLKVGLEITFLNVLILISILFVIKALANICSDYLLGMIRINVEIDKKQSLYKSLLSTELDYLYQYNFGRITNIIITETRMMGMLVDYVSRFLTTVINLIIYIAIVFLVSWQLSLITLGFAGLFYYLVKKVFLKAQIFGREVTKINGFIQELVNYTLSGYRVVKSFVCEDSFDKRFKGHLKKWKSVNRKLIVTESLLRSVFEPVVLIVVVFVFIFYQFDVAVFITFMVALSRMYMSFQGIQNAHYKMAKHVASLEVYEETMGYLTINQYHDDGKGIKFDQLRDGISFSDLSYAYKTSKSDFRIGPLSLNIPAGQMVAFVGKSGSGKSTCVDLIEGFLRPDRGVIEIDGRYLFEYDLFSFRKKVGYVSQNIFLLNDTIYNNIAFRNNSVTMEQIKEACNLANATEFIEQLPERHHTLLGENGTRLSGGQKQRIALARALVNMPEILILDEATSALDNISEKQVQAAIDSLSGNMTIIVIAHRLSTVKNTDYIYFFENGKVVEQGTFEDLITRKGLFYEMSTVED